MRALIRRAGKEIRRVYRACSFLHGQSEVVLLKKKTITIWLLVIYKYILKCSKLTKARLICVAALL